ncbi:MAG: hypothetical protein B6I20_06015, partial [Bacteroidetes bacterium 4572_117]
MKNNPKINWRYLLLSIAKQFQYLVGQNIEIIEDAKKTKQRLIKKQIKVKGLEKQKKGLKDALREKIRLQNMAEATYSS